MKTFFDSLGEEQKDTIQAVTIDTWDPPYIKAIRKCCPKAVIVFDQFHLVKAFGRVIDRVRRQEYQQATQEEKKVMKGSKYLLLKNLDHLLPQERPRLQRVPKPNQNLLKYYAYGIYNHCLYPLHTSRLEGINNQIKVMKRKAFGYHDLEYFSLIIKDSFARCN